MYTNDNNNNKLIHSQTTCIYKLVKHYKTVIAHKSTSTILKLCK